MRYELDALVKQSTVKNNTLVIQLEVWCLNQDAVEVMKRTGEEMSVCFESKQITMTIDDETGEVY